MTGQNDVIALMRDGRPRSVRDIAEDLGRDGPRGMKDTQSDVARVRRWGYIEVAEVRPTPHGPVNIWRWRE